MADTPAPIATPEETAVLIVNDWLDLPERFTRWNKENARGQMAELCRWPEGDEEPTVVGRFPTEDDAQEAGHQRDRDELAQAITEAIASRDAEIERLRQQLGWAYGEVDKLTGAVAPNLEREIERLKRERDEAERAKNDTIEISDQALAIVSAERDDAVREMAWEKRRADEAEASVTSLTAQVERMRDRAVAFVEAAERSGAIATEGTLARELRAALSPTEPEGKT